jgi:hypothetical protein
MGRYGNYPNPDLCKKYGCYKQKIPFAMGCPGCLLSEKERQELIDKVSQDARQSAIREKMFMVIYNLPDGKIAFMEADKARAAGITPIKYISHL